MKKIGAGKTKVWAGKNSQPLKSEVKNTPHPPWFEACTHINIIYVANAKLFRKFAFATSKLHKPQNLEPFLFV